MCNHMYNIRPVSLLQLVVEGDTHDWKEQRRFVEVDVRAVSIHTDVRQTHTLTPTVPYLTHTSKSQVYLVQKITTD